LTNTGAPRPCGTETWPGSAGEPKPGSFRTRPKPRTEPGSSRIEPKNCRPGSRNSRTQGSRNSWTEALSGPIPRFPEKIGVAVLGIVRQPPRAQASHEIVEPFVLQMLPDRFLDQGQPDGHGTCLELLVKTLHANLDAGETRTLNHWRRQVTSKVAELDLELQSVCNLILAARPQDERAQS
jgi:hypothetical protein